MGFKKTSEGRVFFEKLEDTANDEVARGAGQNFRPKPFANNAPAQDPSTQVQIVALLKALNERLKTTQAERNQMRKELDAYRDLIGELESKSERSEKAFLTLQKKLTDGSPSGKAEALANEAITEMEETRRLLLSLEGKSEKADALLIQLKNDVTRHQSVGNQLIKRQKSLEEQQKRSAEKVTEQNQIAAKIIQRVKDGEERFESLSDKLEETSTEQARIGRKLDKALEERARFMRKIERIEETVLQMRDSLNAKAMVLLTDQEMAPEDQAHLVGQTGLLKAQGAASVSASPEAMRAQAQEDDSIEIKPVHLAILAGVVVAGIAGVWLVNNLDRFAQSELFKLERSEAPSLEETADIAPILRQRFGNTETIEESSPEVEAEPEVTASIIPQTSQSANFTDDIGTMALDTPEQIEAAIQGLDIDTVAPEMNAIEPGEQVQVAAADPAADAEPQPAVQNEQPDEAVSIDTSSLDLEKLAQDPSSLIKPDASLGNVIQNIEKQAFEGVAEAQHDLAAIYTAGHGGVAQDFERARFWFEQAAARGVANAAYNLGVIYHQGLGTTADIEKALQWYDVAATENHPEAQYNLGIAYIEGIGVPYSAEKATEYFTNAAGSNIMEAAYNLGLIHENGLLGSAKPDEALMWYKIAADQGSPEAKQALEQLAKTIGIDTAEVNRLADGMKELKKPETVEAIAERVQNTQPNESLSLQILTSQVQDYLMQFGLYPGPADGISGPLTADAVRSYQRQNTLDVDGKVSQGLLDHMAEKLGQ